MRFLRELFNPKLKCVRLGHKPTIRKWRGYTRSAIWSSAVAMNAEKTETVCRRCDEVIEATVRELGSIHSLTMPGDWMRRFRESGEIWLEVI